ncbi:hypothetical protein [Enterobacter sp.]|uniref:hypothetical protein n=1 Tax=Enterobacter sp. TaxID=42895 RepID=UPI00290EA36D|nr:hypothetical protein [Enterobacter sp.]MDU7342609.1 hypothetical protein [Enterobacter sp.]
MSVKRYEWVACDEHSCHCDVVESAEGDMVDYEDYAALEARYAALAAENASLDNFIAASCFVYAGELGYWPAIDHSPEIPATNQFSVAESQFLTDVMTAAGLLSCGKRDKQLAQRLADFCVSKRDASSPAQLRKGVQS